MARFQLEQADVSQHRLLCRPGPGLDLQHDHCPRASHSPFRTAQAEAAFLTTTRTWFCLFRRHTGRSTFTPILWVCTNPASLRLTLRLRDTLRARQRWLSRRTMTYARLPREPGGLSPAGTVSPEMKGWSKSTRTNTSQRCAFSGRSPPTHSHDLPRSRLAAAPPSIIQETRNANGPPTRIPTASAGQ